jgi:tetratricopeptide (TPR) repeat protein
MYVLKGAYNEALNDYGLAVKAFKNRDSILHYRMLLAACNMYAGEYNMALTWLDSVSRYKYRVGLRPYYTLRAVAHFGAENYDSAQYYFTAMLPDTAVKARAEVAAMFYDIEKGAGHKYRGAMVMSYILPGSGQIMLGNVGDGLDAFFLTSAFAALTVVTSVVYTPAEGLLSTFQWWLRYYKGNLNHVKDQAEYKRFNNRACLYRQVLQVVNAGAGQ